MKKYTHNNIEVLIYDIGFYAIGQKGNNDLLLHGPVGRSNFEVAVPGKKQIYLGEGGFSFQGVKESDKGLELTYRSDADSLEVTVELDFIKDTDLIVQSCRAKNIGNETVTLTKFSSAIIDRVASSEDISWDKNPSLKIHLCHNKWQGEAQWVSYSPKDLGLYAGSIHPWERASYKLHSVGSWPACNFFPLVIVEDTEHGNAWFVETEGAHSWQIKLSCYGGYVKPSLAIEASGCDETNGGWFIELAAGEEYSTERAFYGVTGGGFEEAVAQLIKFKRADSVQNHKNGYPPVFFNDYMNCVWGNQDPEIITKLIDKAAEVGCEYFVIDGGWESNSGGDGLGDWIEKPSLYSKITIADLAKKIIKKGMVPGIWFELESCNKSTAYGATLDDDALLKRYGASVGHDDRCFYNLTNPKVRQYLKSRVREYYDMGYRFIKNDYNQNTGIGCTNTYEGSSCAEGLIRHSKAFYSFIDELYEEFPDLVIENCSSGAMRGDNKTLRRFALQSTSDQELYYNNPSIIMGSTALMPPEKAGNWSYPYAASFDKHMSFNCDDAYMKTQADGKETVFNTVNTLMGVFYQSGRIDRADPKNTALIKEGISIYKRIRKYHKISRPVYPLGMHSINVKEPAVLGLLSDNRLMLAIWNIQDTRENISLDLTKYVGQNAAIETIYSAEDYSCSLLCGRFSAKMTDMSALFVEISF